MNVLQNEKNLRLQNEKLDDDDDVGDCDEDDHAINNKKEVIKCKIMVICHPSSTFNIMSI